MKLVKTTPVIALSLFSMILGCSGAEPAGYGYEFVAESMTSRGMPAAAQPVTTAAQEGRLAPELIQATIRARSAPITACYQAALTATPDLAGDLTVRFSIGEDGVVEAPRIEQSTLPAGPLSGCVAAAFGALRFPASTGGTAVVLYPIRFAP